MMKKIVLSVVIVLMTIVNGNHSFAAFPVGHASVAASKYDGASGAVAHKQAAQLINQIKTSDINEQPVHRHHKKSGWQGIVSFICGVAAFGVMFASLPVALILTLLAIVFGALGLGKRRHRNTGLALAGLILGSVGFVLVSTVIVIISILKSVVTGINVM